MEKLIVKKNQSRDTATIAELGMLAYRVFPEAGQINIQLLNGLQEECTIPFKNGEKFTLREVEVCLVIT